MRENLVGRSQWARCRIGSQAGRSKLGEQGSQDCSRIGALDAREHKVEAVSSLQCIFPSATMSAVARLKGIIDDGTDVVEAE